MQTPTTSAAPTSGDAARAMCDAPCETCRVAGPHRIRVVVVRTVPRWAPAALAAVYLPVVVAAAVQLGWLVVAAGCRQTPAVDATMYALAWAFPLVVMIASAAVVRAAWSEVVPSAVCRECARPHRRAFAAIGGFGARLAFVASLHATTLLAVDWHLRASPFDVFARLPGPFVALLIVLAPVWQLVALRRLVTANRRPARVAWAAALAIGAGAIAWGVVESSAIRDARDEVGCC